MYLRKSRAEENEPVSETLARHREILEAFAERENIKVTEIYEEVASGESLFGRPQMLKLLENLAKYEAVLCMDIDRLGRGNMHEQGLIFDGFRKAEVLIITPVKTYDMTDDLDDSLISFKALFAREEYKMIRGRLTRGKLKAIQEGCYLSNPPFGYKSARIDKKPTLVIVPEEAKCVRMMFKMYNEGYGCQIIADTVNALGFKPRRTAKFGRTTVAAILKNPVYIGKVTWNRFKIDKPSNKGEKQVKTLKPFNEWIIVDGIHEPIIDEDTFSSVNKKYSERYHPPYHKAGKVENPLSGILFCKQCGRAISRQPLTNKKYGQPVMYCPTGGCSMSSNLSAVENLFYSVLRDNLHEMKAAEPKAIQNNETDIYEAANDELMRLKKQLATQYELLERGIYDIEIFLSRRDEINNRISYTEEIMNKAKKQPNKEILIHKIENLLDAYWEGVPLERNQIIKAVVAKATYYKPKGSRWGSSPEIEIIEWRE